MEREFVPCLVVVVGILQSISLAHCHPQSSKYAHIEQAHDMLLPFAGNLGAHTCVAEGEETAV